MHQIDIGEALSLCRELPAFQERLYRVGLHKTTQKIDAAVMEIGYEVAEHIENEREGRDK